MNTVIQLIEQSTTGAPTAKEIEHDKRAVQHFIKNCDTVKCIKGNEQSKKSNWHTNGFCLECTLIPTICGQQVTKLNLRRKRNGIS